jgi:hypothetical protein
MKPIGAWAPNQHAVEESLVQSALLYVPLTGIRGR